MLTGVTLTGADDTVQMKDLIALSNEFPFVEWGILISNHVDDRKRPRFPSWNWLKDMPNYEGGNFSLHICGSYLLDIWQMGIMPFNSRYEVDLQAKFSRAQLNFHGDAIEKDDGIDGEGYPTLSFALSTDNDSDWEFIVQLDDVNNWVLDELKKDHPRLKLSGLYDCSHGAGIKPDKWPVPNSNWKVGYAGGLGPDDLEEDIKAILEVAGDQPIWIDMETKIRSFVNGKDIFDLDKCRVALEKASKFIGV